MRYLLSLTLALLFTLLLALPSLAQKREPNGMISINQKTIEGFFVSGTFRTADSIQNSAKRKRKGQIHRTLKAGEAVALPADFTLLQLRFSLPLYLKRDVIHTLVIGAVGLELGQTEDIVDFDCVPEALQVDRSRLHVNYVSLTAFSNARELSQAEERPLLSRKCDYDIKSARFSITKSKAGRGETLFTDGQVDGYYLDVAGEVDYTHPNGEDFSVSFEASRVFVAKPVK